MRSGPGIALLASFVVLVAIDILRAEPPQAPATLEVGQQAPLFESTDEYGRPWSLAKHLNRKTIVLYFYPGDFTTGCTRQAQNFREHMHALTARGFKVVGISGDSPATHQLFKQSHELNYTLLSDAEGAVARQFGVPLGAGGKARARGRDGQVLSDADGKAVLIDRPVTLARWMFILDRDGKVTYKNTKVDPVKSAQEVLQFLDELEKKSP